MAYFPDLSFYEYTRDSPAAKNVGWLERDHDFERAPPSEETLDLLWRFCSISVVQLRGRHDCDLCAAPHVADAVRNGQRLALGSAEIRVFSRERGGTALNQRLNVMESGGLLFFRGSLVPCSVYAAPNLIYHYVHAHHYKPPDEFLRALHEGPQPPDEKYFEFLTKLDLEWNRTYDPAATERGPAL